MPFMLDKICGMLAEGSAELQCAAAMVLGELKSKDAAVRRALVQALKSSNDTVRLYAVEALAKIGAEEVVPHLIPLLGAAAPLKSRAMKVISEAGSAVIDALREKQKDADPEIRKGILEALAKIGKEDATDLLLRSMKDRDPSVLAQAVSSFQNVVGSMSDSVRKSTAKKVLAFLKSGVSVVPSLQILGTLRDASVAKHLLRFTDRKQPAETRTAALRALAAFPFGSESRQFFPKLLPLLEETDWMKPALEVLERMKPDVRRVFRLLEHANPAVRAFALRALGAVAAAESAEALVAALGSPDREIAEAAAAALRSNPGFVRFLIPLLATEPDLSRAWKIVDVLRTLPGGLDAKTRKALLERCLKLLEKRDERYRVYFELLRTVALDELRAALLRKGRAATAKKRYDEAEQVLRLLEPDDMATGESDYALAIARLKQRKNDPAILLFAKLQRREDFPLAKQIEKDTRLFAPGDLLHLGFRFIERQGAERDFGAQVLQIVTRRFASSREGTVAKQKLKTQGMA